MRRLGEIATQQFACRTVAAPGFVRTPTARVPNLPGRRRRDCLRSTQGTTFYFLGQSGCRAPSSLVVLNSGLSRRSLLIGVCRERAEPVAHDTGLASISCPSTPVVLTPEVEEASTGGDFMTRGGVKISQKVEQELVITSVECTGDGCCDLKGSIALPYTSHTCKCVEEFLGWST